MSVNQPALEIAQTRAKERRFRRYTSVALLLAPTLFFMLVVFVFGLLHLFQFSLYRFDGLRVEYTLSLEAYARFFNDPFYLDVLLEGFRLGSVTTAACLLIGYPVAYAMSRIRNQRYFLLAFIIIFSPLLTSVIVRAYGWLLLLAGTGAVNYVLVQLGIVEEPIRLLYNFFGVTVALVHVLLPFTVFPMISVLRQQDPALKEAAADLGANRWETFRHVTFPISLPGLISAFQLTFVLSMTAYVTPKLLGGGRVMVLPILIFDSLTTLDWPLTAVMAIVLLTSVLSIVFISNLLFRRLYQGIGLEVSQ